MNVRRNIIKGLSASLLLGGMLTVFSSCRDEEVSNRFCSLPARFSFSPVNSISQLFTSCESMGEWCTITLGDNGKTILFTKPAGKNQEQGNKNQGVANLTALDGYKGFYMGLSGFIVGLPDIPEVGETRSVVTCYDLACRNCYDQYVITRPLVLREGGLADCQRCRRTYNLNNTGIVCDGEPGKPLFRYRVYYGNQTLSINNR